jgi:hypothetical protein
MHRWPIALLSALVCALALTACGGGGDDVDVDQVLKETFGEDKNIKSGRLDLKVGIDAKGGQSQGPVSLSLSGPFASTKPTELPRFDFTAAVEAGGQTIDAGATSTADKGFVSLRGTDYALPDDMFAQFKQQYAASAKEGEGEKGVSLKALGVDPQRWLSNPKSAGKEDVGGTETIHIKAGIDVPKLLEDVNKVLSRADQVPGGQAQAARELTEAERKQVADAIKSASVDVWTGEEDKIMRRINVELSFDVPEGERDRTQGLTSGTVRFDMSLGAINDDPKIEAPAGAKPLTELAQAIQSGGLGAGGAGGAPATPAPGTPAPAPEAGGGGDAYQQCVDKAAGDIRAMQECAELIGK